MTNRKRRALFMSISAGVVVVTTVGGFVQREAACAGLADQHPPEARIKIRRGTAGVCQICREGGSLYDIAFDRCSDADSIYTGFKLP